MAHVGRSVLSSVKVYRATMAYSHILRLAG